MILKAILLGIIQGLTEFLPVSSSGHLVIFQRLLGFKTHQLTISIFLHFGTLIPVIIIFWSDIKKILSIKRETRYLTLLIFIGIIPAGMMGIFLKDQFARLFSSVTVTGIMLLITGFLLYAAEMLTTGGKKIDDLKYHNALLVGLFQGLAIIPGISRSGSTIAASLFQGLERGEAARYSFLLSLPVIMGAGLLETVEVAAANSMEIDRVAVAAGVMASAAAGYFAIKYLLHILKKGKLTIFSYYCWGLGILVILIAGLF